jgi:hypothetical protein
MGQFRGIIYRLVGEAREVLFGKLIMVRIGVD